MRRIGIVGMGLLGSAVAARLLQGGYEVIGYDTRLEALQALAPQGLRAASSLAEAAEGCDAVFTILPSLESVEAVFLDPRGLVKVAPRETVLIQMSTISPQLVQRLAEAAKAGGVRFLDAPVSGTSAMVERGDCTILVGGDAGSVSACQPVFSAIASRVVQVGGIGSASLAKLATNLLVALNTAALAEALVLGAKGGIEHAQMLEVLQGTAASSRMMEIRGPLMVAGSFQPQMKLSLFLKDLRLMLEEAKRLGVSLPLTRTAQELYVAAGEAGLGPEDLASVIIQLERMAGFDRAGS